MIKEKIVVAKHGSAGPLSDASPYSYELVWYKENDIPLWESVAHKNVDLGRIWTGHDGSWIEVVIKPMPSQFFDFKIYCAENKKEIKLSTGSGCLSEYFPMMKKLATDMVNIKSITEKLN